MRLQRVRHDWATFTILFQDFKHYHTLLMTPKDNLQPPLHPRLQSIWCLYLYVHRHLKPNFWFSQSKFTSPQVFPISGNQVAQPKNLLAFLLFATSISSASPSCFPLKYVSNISMYCFLWHCHRVQAIIISHLGHCNSLLMVSLLLLLPWSFFKI